MVLFISYPFSALGHDISPRVDRLDDISTRSDIRIVSFGGKQKVKIVGR
jgi:hypothetical protein